jgi:hypothetical protein
MIENNVIMDRAPQIEKLKLDISTAATSAQQAGVAMADVVLALLERADELCELANDTGADMAKLAEVFGSSADV